MGLVKAQGNMYSWVSHTYGVLRGECPHDCAYCYIKSFHPTVKKLYKGPFVLAPDLDTIRFGEGKKIFIAHTNDLFADAVPDEMVIDVLAKCKQFPRNLYVFQSKNPGRFRDTILKAYWPPCCLFGTTIESDIWYDVMGEAPKPFDRIMDFTPLEARKFVTFEPIMDFNVDVLLKWLKHLKPEFVTIGADSKGHNLVEPNKGKLQQFIAGIENLQIEIRVKDNLGRILNGPTRQQ